jgi:PAS domain-containing protein
MTSAPLLEALKQLTGALLDAYAVVDTDLHIVDFNPSFYSLFPRHVARQLKRKSLDEVLSLELGGQPLDIAQDCMAKATQLRYDEVVGHVADGDPLDFIVAATPLLSRTQETEGAFVTLRNVTDEAQVQTKYKTMLDEEARERELLQRRIHDAETQLVEVKDQLAVVEQELLDFKKGLLI